MTLIQFRRPNKCKIAKVDIELGQTFKGEKKGKFVYLFSLSNKIRNQCILKKILVFLKWKGKTLVI